MFQANAPFGSPTFGPSLSGLPNLTATGNNQASALPISAGDSVFTSVPAGTGCRLPTPSNQPYTIYNQSSGVLLVYPAFGDCIAPLQRNIPMRLPPDNSVTFSSFSSALTVQPRSWYVTIGGSATALNDQTFFNIVAYGADPTATTDSSVGIANAVAALAAAGSGVLYVPAGVFWFSSEITLPNNCAVVGAGIGVSVLRGTTTNGTMFNYDAEALTASNVSFTNLNFDGGAAGVTAIAATYGALITISQCLFTGIAYTCNLDRCESARVFDNLIRGNATYAQGQILVQNSTLSGGYDATSGYIRHNINDGSATFGVAGAQVSPLILVDTVENTEVSSNQALWLNTLAPNTIGHIEIRGVSQGILCDNNSSVGASVGINLTVLSTFGDAPSYVNLTGNVIDSFGTAAIDIAGTGSNQIDIIDIVGGVISAPLAGSTGGIVVAHDGFAITITGVQFYQWMGYPTPSGTGISLQSAAECAISNCNFSQLTAGVALSGSGGRIILTGNIFRSNTADITGTLSGNGSVFTSNTWSSNNPWNTLPSLTLPTLGTSGSAIVNTTPFPVLISIQGGTVSAISFDGVSVGISGTWVLPPGSGHYITPVYSVAPSFGAAAMF